METSLRDLHNERDSLQNGIELLTVARDNEQQRERKKTIKKQLDSWRRELRSNQQRISRLEELLGLEQPQQPPTAQGPLDVIVEETTETTVMTDEESESEATPLGGPTDEATTPVRETEQDMETEGEGGNSPVTPNEDDLLTGASAADVETGIASLHIDSPAKPRSDDDAATLKKQTRGETPCRAPPGSTGRVVCPAAPMRPNEDPAGTEKATHHTTYF